MDKKGSGLIAISLKYLRHRLLAGHRNGYGIHSPFVYDLVRNAIFNKNRWDVPGRLREYHDAIRNADGSLQVHDLGAGSRLRDSFGKVTASRLRSNENKETGSGNKETGSGNKESGSGKKEAGSGTMETGRGQERTENGKKETGIGQEVTDPGKERAGNGKKVTENGKKMTNSREEVTADVSGIGKMLTGSEKDIVESEKEITGNGKKVTENGKNLAASSERMISSIARRSSVTRRQGALLYRLAKWYRPAAVIETGTGIGISTSYLAAGAGHAGVTTIEGSPAKFRFAQLHTDVAGSGGLEFLLGSFDTYFDGLIDNAPNRTLFFIDGDHRYVPTMQRISSILSREELSETMVILDDIYWSDEMERAWKTSCAYPGVDISLDLFHMGILIRRPGISRHHFRINF